MNLLGIHLTLKIGREEPSLASPFIVENLRSVEVTQQAEGPSGFEMTFHVGRSSVIDLLDYRLLSDPLLKPFNRVVILVRFAVAPVVVMDGIITDFQLSPSNEPGASTLTVTGQDISLLMDREQINRESPTQSDYTIVSEIVKAYEKYGMKLLPDPLAQKVASNPPNPNDERPQSTLVTDRAFLQELAQLYGFLFYVRPGPAPGTSLVHWGPPDRSTKQSGELSVNMGAFSNVELINFHYDGLRPQQVAVNVNQREITIAAPGSSRSVRLAGERAEPRRKVFLACGDPRRMELRAQGMVERFSDEVVTATGELDAPRYNRLLEPHTVVKVRGAGQSYDGLYQVKSVTHTIGNGRYTQRFTLTRDGTKPARSTPYHTAPEMTLMNEFFGKYRGIVEDNFDPLGRGRLLVKVPTVFGDGTVWALPCTPYAGPGVGLFAMPPKNAHVWIEFECGDSRSAIWSGCFWDEDESAPVAASSTAAEKKVLKTQNCTLTLDDSSGNSGGVTIEMGDAKIAIDPLQIEITRGAWSIKITDTSVSINDGALEVI